MQNMVHLKHHEPHINMEKSRAVPIVAEIWLKINCWEERLSKKSIQKEIICLI